MIRAGDTIENPVTGERIVFHQTSRETNGEAVVFETQSPPHAQLLDAEDALPRGRLTSPLGHPPIRSEP